MSTPADAPGGSSRPALTAGIACYTLWGFLPGLFIVMGRAGAGPWEIVGQRVLWSMPCALLLVVLARQGGEVLRLTRRPRVIGWLALSTAAIATNWTLFVWAVSRHHTLDCSLGYYINPLLNMAVGAMVFRERINRVGQAAIALAVVGVVLQTLALGHAPVIALSLAASFCAYGVIRKQVVASAQAGLLIECLFLVAPGAAYVAWLYLRGGGIFGHGLGPSLLMLLAGPATVVPLALFAWTARRLPLSTMGFLQFIAPTIGFAIGVATGESVTPLRLASFAFIWGGAAVFMLGAWRASRIERAVARIGA